MNRSTFRRVALLEANQRALTPAVHRLIVQAHEDEAPHIAALIASGASERDVFIIRRIVSPPARASAG